MGRDIIHSAISVLVKLCYPKVRKEVRSERRVTSSTEKHKADQVGTYWSHGQCVCDSGLVCLEKSTSVKTSVYSVCVHSLL